MPVSWLYVTEAVLAQGQCVALCAVRESPLSAVPLSEILVTYNQLWCENSQWEFPELGFFLKLKSILSPECSEISPPLPSSVM